MHAEGQASVRPHGAWHAACGIAGGCMADAGESCMHEQTRVPFPPVRAHAAAVPTERRP